MRIFRPGRHLPSAFKRKAIFTLGIALWAGAFAVGYDRVMRWESTPGPDETWTGKAPKSEKPWKLLMIAHPECPCTKASLTQLENVLATYPNRVEATVVFVTRKAQANTVNIARALSIPNLQVSYCTEQIAFDKYHAQTSGQTYLFGANGKVRFSGGLTEGRDQQGRSTIPQSIGRILDGSGETISAPVYGCALQTKGAKS